MSVLICDVEVFEYLHVGLITSAFNTTVDKRYSHVIQQHMRGKGTDQIYEETKRLVRSWSALNTTSFAVKYTESVRDDSNRIKDRSYRTIPEQVLKYAECVRYNIELVTMREKGYTVTDQQRKDVDLLEAWIKDIATAIAHASQEYKDAKWSS